MPAVTCGNRVSIYSCWKERAGNSLLFGSCQVQVNCLRQVQGHPVVIHGFECLGSPPRVLAIMARVGVWTRPQESWALYLQVRALVPFIPTSQSASARATAAAVQVIVLPARLFRWAKPFTDRLVCDGGYPQTA